MVKSLPPFSCSSAKASARKARRLPSSASGPHPSGFASDLSLPGPLSLQPSLGPRKGPAGGSHVDPHRPVSANFLQGLYEDVVLREVPRLAGAMLVERVPHLVPRSRKRLPHRLCNSPLPGEELPEGRTLPACFSSGFQPGGAQGLPTPGSCGASWPRQFSALRSPGQALSGCLPRHF